MNGLFISLAKKYYYNEIQLVTQNNTSCNGYFKPLLNKIKSWVKFMGQVQVENIYDLFDQRHLIACIQ